MEINGTCTQWRYIHVVKSRCVEGTFIQLLLATLKKKVYLLFTLVLTVAFTALYVFLDLRQGGTHNTMLNTHTVTPQYLGDHFGWLYIYSSFGASWFYP